MVLHKLFRLIPVSIHSIFLDSNHLRQFFGQAMCQLLSALLGFRNRTCNLRGLVAPPIKREGSHLSPVTLLRTRLARPYGSAQRRPSAGLRVLSYATKLVDYFSATISQRERNVALPLADRDAPPTRTAID
jgi:hypothetical protein